MVFHRHGMRLLGRVVVVFTVPGLLLAWFSAPTPADASERFAGGKRGRDFVNDICQSFAGDDPPVRFIGFVPADGATLIRDPRSIPPWRDISSVPGYPGHAIDCDLDGEGGNLLVTVRSATGQVAQTRCTVEPIPGTHSSPPWPENCAAFTDITPPDRQRPFDKLRDRGGR
jgi:hypothetical protein